MTKAATEKLWRAANGVRQAVGPEDEGLFGYYGSLIARDYERCHPGDSFEAMKLRACFSKEDQGLLKQWMAIAAARDATLRRERGGVGMARIAA
ncbi:MAG: hypothetical protein L0I29_09430 [Hyphomicrobiales bacterium]|nr:hypothetical protein [Hyphomicrobiales bacterium]